MSSVVCGDICPFDDFVPLELARAYSYIFAEVRLRPCMISAPSTTLSCLSLPELTRTFFAEVRLRPYSILSPLTRPRTPSARVPGWVRVSARVETRGKNRERVAHDRRGLVDDTGLLKVVIFAFVSDASHEAPL